MLDPVEKLCAVIRAAHPDMVDLFCYGQCYNFFLILRTVYPQAEPWYDQIEGHVYTRIGKFWYDVRGKHLRVSEACQPLDHKRGDKPHRWGTRDHRSLVAS